MLDYRLLEQLKPFLSSIKPRPAVFDHNYVKKIDGPNVKKGKTKMDLAEQLREDIRDFKKTSGASRLITMWCGSTESYIEPTEAHQSVKAFEKALRENDEMIAPSMIYAYASLMEGVPFANGAPNLTVDLPVMLELSRKNEAPDLRQGFQDRSDADEDRARARLQGAHAGPERMVFHQHSGQSRRRSARRSRIVQDQGRIEARRAGAHSAARTLSRALRQHVSTRSASTITRRAATTKKAGTTSTSSDGWAIPCRSRSISSAAIRFWPRRSCSIWCCSWTWRSAARAARWAFRSG